MGRMFKPSVNRTFYLAATLLWFVILCELQSASAQSVVPLVPRGAVAVARLDWNVVRHDEHFKRMLNAEQLNRGLAQMSVADDDISEVVIFSGVNSTSSGTIGGIFRGKYKPQLISTQLQSQNLVESTYKGHTLYFNSTDRSFTTLLRSGALVIGSEKGVKGVVDVEENPQSALTLRQPFNNFLITLKASSTPVSFVIAIPNEYRSIADIATKVVSVMFSMGGLGPLGFVMDKIGVPYALGFSIERDDANYPVLLLAQMKDSTSATLISGSLNMLQGISATALAGQISSAQLDALKNLTVSRNDAVLTIKMILREQDLPR